ncbi:hypothetical protein SprV_0401457700 [Sparganum proliferum]
MTTKSARDDRKQYQTETATSVKQASDIGDTRKLYQLIRQVTGEVADATRNKKAPTKADIYKSCVDTSAPWPHKVIDQGWIDEVAPDDWGLAILVPILKKGDKTRCKNYRGISLIDVSAKIFAVVLLRRSQTVRDSRRGPTKPDFVLGVDSRTSYQQLTAVCFVEFAAAFDSVHRESLGWIIALDAVPPKIVTMVKAYYRFTTARILVLNNLPQPFGIRSGV